MDLVIRPTRPHCTALHFNDEFNLSQYKEQVGLSNEALMPRARSLYVQRAVNREQCFEQVKAFVQRSRELRVDSISFDLIYGLPLQTPETFHETLQEIISVKPDRLALYNYAHIPDRMPAQRLINSDDLPPSADKLTILSDSIISLSNAGYEYIGMDHFALPSDSLYKAQQEGSLQRNFQGYSTHSETDLIGLGVSAIPKVNECYSQNVLDIPS